MSQKLEANMGTIVRLCQKEKEKNERGRKGRRGGRKIRERESMKEGREIEKEGGKLSLLEV